MRFTPTALSLLLLFSCAEDAELKRTRSLANAGDATAQYNLGVMYRKGDGVPQDYEKAFRLFKLLADQGDSIAQFSLGTMYDYGEGVPKDYKEAYAWWSVAKSNGHEVAAMNLGMLEKEMTEEQIAERMSLATEIYNRIEANGKD